MPLDPLDPNHLALTPQQRAADKFATLDRRVGVAERSSANLVTRSRFYAEELSEVSTTSGTYVDLGGPSVTVTVPVGGFVALYAAADLHSTNGTLRPLATAGLMEPTDYPTPIDILTSGSFTYESLVTGGSAAPNGIGGRLVYPATPGVRTYSIRYVAFGGSAGLAIFARNRRLWVEVL